MCFDHNHENNRAKKKKKNTNERHTREEELAFDNFIWVDSKTESVKYI